MTNNRPSRILAILDDEFYKEAKDLGAQDAENLSITIQVPLAVNDKHVLAKMDASSHLACLLTHADRGHFYGLKTIRIFDLQTDSAEHLLKLEQGNSEENVAILLDILNEEEQYPFGLDVAERLDPTKLAGRIAWFTVTSHVTSEYKPYPLIAKSEIPPVSEEGGTVQLGAVPSAHGGSREKYRDTVFLWWAFLFDKNGKLAPGHFNPDISPRDLIQQLRDTRLLSHHNVEAAARVIFARSSKRSGRGGLAGNILEPVYWQVLDGGESHGRIENAFLKISAKGASLNDEIDLLGSEALRGILNMPAVLVASEQEEEVGPPNHYCMARAPGQSLSDLVFEKIGFAETVNYLALCLDAIVDAHRKVMHTGELVEANRHVLLDNSQRRAEVLKYVEKIANRIHNWVDANPTFEAITAPKALVINNRPYFNALPLCDAIRKELGEQGRLEGIAPRARTWIHGDVVAQNIFVEPPEIPSNQANIWFIDPKAKTTDYLIDYTKLLSSFTAQGHLEYLRQHPESRCAHFSVNEGTDPTRCYYVCSPALNDMAECRQAILKRLMVETGRGGVYTQIDSAEAVFPRLLLHLAGQYIGAPPFRDSDRFHDEMKLLYYRGVEILNEFCATTGTLPRRGWVIDAETHAALTNQEERAD